MAPRCCVIICYWSARSPRGLFQLLRQMLTVPSGQPFDVLIVNNGGDQRPLVVPAAFNSLAPQVLDRPNDGWNLGAWDAGWRHASGYDYYLFLQSECVIRSPGWLARFVLRMQMEPGIGLLGERLMWQGMTWDYAREATRLDIEEQGKPVPAGLLETIDTYRNLLSRAGIDPGQLCTHLVSVVLFSRREVLERVDGILAIGNTYSEAVASEIGTSRRVANAGYRLSQITDEPFTRFAHSDWTNKGWLSRSKHRALHKLDRLRGWR